MEKLNYLSQQGFTILCESLDKCNLKKKCYSEGQPLMRQGQVVTEIYKVEFGKVGINYSCQSGKTFRLGTHLVEKHLFGDLEFLTGQVCQYNVYADEDITVEVIPFSLLFELIKTHPEISIWLSQNIAARNLSRSKDLIKKLINPLHYNIAMDLYQRSCGKSQSNCYNNMQKDSERFGCTTRAYSRIISDLVSYGLVEKKHGTISVYNLDKLKSYIENYYATEKYA